MASDGIHTISQEVAVILEKEGLVKSIINNKRISTSTISPTPSLTSRSTSASSASGFTPESFNASFVNEEVDEVEIPAELRSLETYALMGFNAETAAELWKRYLEHATELDAEFLDFARWHIDNPEVPDATSETDDWNECMRRLGINDKLRDAIMLPEFSDIRFTATCKYWIMDALDVYFETLRNLDERMRMKAARIQHGRKIPGTRKVAGSFTQPPSLSGPVGYQSLSEQDPVSPSFMPAALPLSIEDPPTPLIATAVATPITILGHTMLWRACAKTRAETFYNEQSGELNLLAMASIPGDFSASNKIVYWTPQRETADRYAQWNKLKYEISEIAIVQAAVPESFINSLNIKHLWVGDEWKRMIWYCRRGRELPRDMDDILTKDLLIGHIASGKHIKYERMVDPTRIREDDVLTVCIDGQQRKAVQWVFSTMRGKRGLEDNCRGKIWVHNLGTLKIPRQRTG